MLLVSKVFVEATLVALDVKVLADDLYEKRDDVAFCLDVCMEAILDLRALLHAVNVG